MHNYIKSKIKIFFPPKKILLFITILLTAFPCLIHTSNNDIAYLKNQNPIKKEVPEQINKSVPILQISDTCWHTIAKFLDQKNRLNLNLVCTIMSLFFRKQIHAFYSMPTPQDISLFLKKIPKNGPINTLSIKQSEKNTHKIVYVPSNDKEIKYYSPMTTQDIHQPIQILLKNLPDLTSFKYNATENFKPEKLDWGNQKKIESFFINSGKFEAEQLQFFLNIFSLKQLSLRCSNTINLDTVDWKNQKNLKFIRLSPFKNIQSVQNFLDSCTKLSDVTLYPTDYKVPEELTWTKQKKLKKLRVGAVFLKKLNFQNVLDSCPNLSFIRFTSVNKELLEKLNWKNQKKLKHLCLYEFSGEGSTCLQNILDASGNLSKLKIYDAAEIDFGKITWKNQKQLMSLKLSSITIKNTELQSILNNCSNLKCLNFGSLYDSSSISSTPSISIFTDLNWDNQKNNLKSLIINHNFITDKGLSNIFRTCQKLEILDLTGCKGLGYEELFLYNQLWNNRNLKLTKLILHEARFSSDNLNFILQAAPSLKTLTISYCLNLFLQSTFWPPENKLEELSLTPFGNEKINKKYIKLIIKRSPHLKKLDFLEEGHRSYEEEDKRHFLNYKDISNLRKK